MENVFKQAELQYLQRNSLFNIYHTELNRGLQLY